MGKRDFFDSTLLGYNRKNAKFPADENLNCRSAYFKRLLSELHPWVGAYSPEGSLRRDKENARPEPASKNATTASCPMGYTPLHMGIFGEYRL